jgi:hypothetical protein
VFPVTQIAVASPSAAVASPGVSRTTTESIPCSPSAEVEAEFAAVYGSDELESLRSVLVRLNTVLESPQRP